MANGINRPYNETDKVSSLMTTSVDMVSPSTSITQAARAMRDSDVGSVPVTDRGQLVGIITDRDIAVRVAADGARPDEVMVKEVMSTELVTIGPDQTIAEASDLMAKHQVRRLPVVDNGKLVGILALGDVATDPDTAEEAASALSDISTPSDLDATSSQPS